MEHVCVNVCVSGGLFLGKTVAQCASGSGGVVSPFNYISINIGGELVPFSQVSLSSVQLRVIELEILSLSLLCFYLLKMGRGHCCYRRQRRRLQSIFPVMNAFPESFLSPIPIKLQRRSRVQRGANRNPPPGTKKRVSQKRAREKKLASGGRKQSSFRRKLTFTYSPLVSAEAFRLKNQRKCCHEKYPVTISDRVSTCRLWIRRL